MSRVLSGLAAAICSTIGTTVQSYAGGGDNWQWVRYVPGGIEARAITVKDGIGLPGVFGFSMIECVPGDTSGVWTLTAYDTQARPFGSCRIEGRAVSCQ